MPAALLPAHFTDQELHLLAEAQRNRSSAGGSCLQHATAFPGRLKRAEYSSWSELPSPLPDGDRVHQLLSGLLMALDHLQHREIAIVRVDAELITALDLWSAQPDGYIGDPLRFVLAGLGAFGWPLTCAISASSTGSNASDPWSRSMPSS
jgi:hypothetical protein